MTRDPTGTPACPEFLADFSDFLDGRLAPARRAEMQAHLDCCEPCLRHLAAYRRGVTILRENGLEVDPADFWGRLEGRMWVEGHLAGEPGGQGNPWRQPALAVGAAALFALVVFGVGLWSSQHWPGGTPVADGGRRVVVAGPSTAAAGVVEPRGLGFATVVPPDPEPAAEERAGSRPDRGVVLASAGRIPAAAPEDGAPEPSDATLETWVEHEFRRLEERVRQDGWEPAPPPTWADAWADPLEVRPAGIAPRGVRVAGFAPQFGVQIWPVETAISIP